MIKPQIIEREGKPEYAVIPIAEWRRIEALLEDLEDIRDLDAALAKPDRRMIPFEVTSATLDGASPVRAGCPAQAGQGAACAHRRSGWVRPAESYHQQRA